MLDSILWITGTGAAWRHYYPDASASSRRKGGIHRNGIGRSHGGLTTKIHTWTRAQGLAIGFCLTPGQASDMTSYGDLMDDDLPDPEAILADKGYDSDIIRSDL